MTKFKEMKFWIGDDSELRGRLLTALTGIGCEWFSGTADALNISFDALYVDSQGRITHTIGDKKWFYDKPYEEVIIDWMRTTKPETVEPETPPVMTKEEAEQQISELQSYIEELDKPKRVRVYIKEDAKVQAESNGRVGWNDNYQGTYIGKVFDVKEVDTDGDLKVWEESHSDWWHFCQESCIVVEGSLEDLR